MRRRPRSLMTGAPDEKGSTPPGSLSVLFGICLDIMRTAHPSYVSLFVDILAQLYEALRPRQLPELTLPQINILNTLDLITPTHPSDLAVKRGVSRAAISQSMRRLIDLGLVESRRCISDRRF